MRLVTATWKWNIWKKEMIESKNGMIEWNSSLETVWRDQVWTIRISKIMKQRMIEVERSCRRRFLATGQESFLVYAGVPSYLCFVVGVTTTGGRSNERVARPPNTPRGSPLGEIYWNFIFMVGEHGPPPPDGCCLGARPDDDLPRERKRELNGGREQAAKREEKRKLKIRTARVCPAPFSLSFYSLHPFNSIDTPFCARATLAVLGWVTSCFFLEQIFTCLRACSMRITWPNHFLCPHLKL